jgi:methyltransferase
MDVSVIAYLGLLLAVGAGRLIELQISTHRQRRLAAQGIVKVPEKHFHWMVVMHIAILLSAGLEVVLLHRSFLPVLGLTMGLLFLLANGLRWWVMATLGKHWNIQVMNSVPLGVVTTGPYRWIRHPNYLAVFLELLALPLIHSAWLTAVCGEIACGFVVRQRLKVEESVLMANPEYRAAMSDKPRFVPRLFDRAARPEISARAEREARPQQTNG